MLNLGACERETSSTRQGQYTHKAPKAGLSLFLILTDILRNNNILMISLRAIDLRGAYDSPSRRFRGENEARGRTERRGPSNAENVLSPQPTSPAFTI